jgi:hypothetical protein
LDNAEFGAIHEHVRKRAYPGRVPNLPPVIVITLRKSGSIYLVQALRQILQVPRVRLGSYGFTEPVVFPKGWKQVKLGACVAQEHLPPLNHIVSALSFVTPAINVHLRDPRRALVSWIGHLDNHLEAGRMIEALAFAEYVVPEGYMAWNFEQRLEWHIQHVLPRMVDWIQGWIRVHDAPSSELKIVLTTLEELQRNPVDCIRRLLDGLQIDIDESWIKVKDPAIGQADIRRDPKMDRKALYSPKLWDQATEMVPRDLRERFGWP